MTAHHGILLPGSGRRCLQRGFVAGYLGPQRLDFCFRDTAFRSDVFRFREPPPRILDSDTRLCLFGDGPLQRQPREFAVQRDQNRTFVDAVPRIDACLFHQSADRRRQCRRLWRRDRPADGDDLYDGLAFGLRDLDGRRGERGAKRQCEQRKREDFRSTDNSISPQ